MFDESNFSSKKVKPVSLAFDDVKAEIKLLNRRYAAIDVAALCRHLDSLAGPKVSETLMNNHERQLGAEDALKLREINPSISLDDAIGILIQNEKITGIGVTQVKLPHTPEEPIHYEIWNPIVASPTGAARSFILSYWAGALSILIGKEVDPTNVTYDPVKNTMECAYSIRHSASM